MDHHDRIIALFIVPIYLLIISMCYIPPISPFAYALLGPVWLYLILPTIFIASVAARSYKVNGFSKFELMSFGFLFLIVAIVNNSLIELQLNDIKSFCGVDPMKSSLMLCILTYSFVHNSSDISSLGVAAFGVGLLVTGVVKEVAG